MKWKEFKEKVEKQGVKDETEIAYIDVSYSEDVDVEFTKYGDAEINSS